jgi:hypothetical protein
MFVRRSYERFFLRQRTGQSSDEVGTDGEEVQGEDEVAGGGQVSMLLNFLLPNKLECFSWHALLAWVESILAKIYSQFLLS